MFSLVVPVNIATNNKTVSKEQDFRSVKYIKEIISHRSLGEDVVHSEMSTQREYLSEIFQMPSLELNDYSLRRFSCGEL